MSIKERWSRFKPLPADIRERLQGLRPLFDKRGILLAYLFGSLAEKGRGEDVDLAILPGERDVTDIRGEISDLLGTERLDIVNLRIASPVLRFHVIKTGILLYKKDDDSENAFEMAAVREYRDTAYMRKRQAEILEARTEEWLSKKK